MSSEEDHFPGDLLTPIFDSDLLQPIEEDIEDLLPVYDEVKKQIEKLQTPPNVTQYLVEPATTPDFKTNMLSGKRLIR